MPSTHDQAAQTKAEILSTALWARREIYSSAWLLHLLKELGQDPANGIFVALHEVQDQGGIFYGGTWLNASREFWAFEVMVSGCRQNLLALERMDNITSEVVITAHGKGTGKSFGWLAIEVLCDIKA